MNSTWRKARPWGANSGLHGQRQVLSSLLSLPNPQFKPGHTSPRAQYESTIAKGPGINPREMTPPSNPIPLGFSLFPSRHILCADALGATRHLPGLSSSLGLALRLTRRFRFPEAEERCEGNISRRPKVVRPHTHTSRLSRRRHRSPQTGGSPSTSALKPAASSRRIILPSNYPTNRRRRDSGWPRPTFVYFLHCPCDRADRYYQREVSGPQAVWQWAVQEPNRGLAHMMCILYVTHLVT